MKTYEDFIEAAAELITEGAKSKMCIVLAMYDQAGTQGMSRGWTGDFIGLRGLAVYLTEELSKSTQLDDTTVILKGERNE